MQKHILMLTSHASQNERLRVKSRDFMHSPV